MEGLHVLISVVACWICAALGFMAGYMVRGIRASRDIENVIRREKDKYARS